MVRLGSRSGQFRQAGLWVSAVWSDCALGLSSLVRLGSLARLGSRSQQVGQTGLKVSAVWSGWALGLSSLLRLGSRSQQFGEAGL